jgi:class 3 adenylate cyclase/tetratricopeptide (TPR) repeat protein
MTVMFCDLVGSTPLAESLDPEDLREVILSYQEACARAVERFDGHVAKFLGDGILVYFGYPVAREDHPQRAVHAGLAIVEEITALNVSLLEQQGVTLHVRVGIHTGTVVAGELVGGAAREQFAIVGETPNIAARIESVAQPDTVVVSHETLGLIEGYFETMPLGERALKGVHREISLHRVVSATGVHNRLDVTGKGRATSMVGRIAELDRLVEQWACVCDGDGAIAHVIGEAGIGKSRFLRALRERLTEIGSVQVWQCSAHNRNTALFPVVGFLERSLGLDPAHRDDRAVELLRAMVADADLDHTEAMPLLTNLLSIPYRADPHAEPLAPLDARAATLRLLESMLVANSALHPLVLIVEDLQWADPTTIDLLARIMGNRPKRVLAAFSFRSGFTPPWSGDDGVVEFELAPLTEAEVSVMVAAAVTRVDPSLIERVVKAADGVPLFVEEMLKIMGAEQEPGRGDPHAMSVPATLRGLLTERLDRLPHLRAVIDAAAVVGTAVSRDLLDGLPELDGADLDADLAALVAHGILRPSSDAASSTYEFSHALLQQTAYDSLLRKQCKTLHAQVAAALVERFPARAEREPELVAHHWVRGGEPAKSLPYWHRAGLRSVERAAFVEAARHFGHGIEALDALGTARDEERAEFHNHLAACLQAGWGYAAPGVDESYARARTACIRANREDHLVSVIRGEWLSHQVRAEYGTALLRAEEMLAFGARTERREVLAEGHLLRAMVRMYRGELEEARLDFERSIEEYHPPESADQVYEAQGDTGVMALGYLAPVLFNLGFDDEALARSGECLALAEQVGGPVTRAQAWGMRSLLHLMRKDAEFAEWVERTRVHSVERNLPYWAHLSELNAGWLRGRSGDLDGGIAALESGIAEYLDTGARLGLASFRVLLADLLLQAGDRDRALAELAAGEAFITETGERFNEPVLFIAKGRTLLAGHAPDAAGAAVAYSAAIESAHRQGARLLELRAAGHLTEQQWTRGEPLTSIDALAELCAWFPADSALSDVRSARGVLARVWGGR